MAISQLDAVNYCLVYAGEAPVNSLTGSNQGADTATALFLLDTVTSEFQERGLDENVYDLWAVPDAVTGQIALPANTIDAYLRERLHNQDPVNKSFIDAIVRDGKLYNASNRTYNWRSPYDYTTQTDDGAFRITIKEQLVWDDLNQTTKRAIMQETAKRYQIVTQADPTVLGALNQESMLSRARSRANDANNKGRTLWNGASWSRYRAVYRDFLGNISRYGRD